MPTNRTTPARASTPVYDLAHIAELTQDPARIALLPTLSDAQLHRLQCLLQTDGRHSIHEKDTYEAVMSTGEGATSERAPSLAPP
ncbi:MAG TPA: hypothetical protein VFH51_16715, partial [Myxococcota bacterium]|nr:hypothetical protein [Myxococcota bacterium]